jgi:SAM-dependent methyltransferase
MFLSQRMTAVTIKGHASECPLCQNVQNQGGWVVNLKGVNSHLITAMHVQAGQVFSANLSYCPFCDFGYFYPRLPPDILQSFYEEGVGLTEWNDAQKRYWMTTYCQRHTINEILSFMRENGFPPESFSGKKVLEIGPGYSALIPVAIKLGMDLTVNEPGKSCADFLEGTFGIPVIRSMLEDIPSELNGQFSMVFSKASLEHHADPDKSLRIMHNLLEPGGILFLTVPNLHSRSFQETSEIHPYYAFPQHLNYFSCKSFRTHLERLNFTSISVTTTTFIGELAFCMDAPMKLGLMLPDVFLLDQLAIHEQLETILVLARRTSTEPLM